MLMITLPKAGLLQAGLLLTCLQLAQTAAADSLQPFTEMDVSRDPELRQAMMKRANGRHTVPQIFIGGAHVGGYDELAALERQGKLDPLLAA